MGRLVFLWRWRTASGFARAAPPSISFSRVIETTSTSCATNCAGVVNLKNTHMPEKRDNPNRLERDAFEREVGTDLDEETPDQPKGMALHTKILLGLALGVIAGISVNKIWG